MSTRILLREISTCINHPLAIRIVLFMSSHATTSHLLSYLPCLVDRCREWACWGEAHWDRSLRPGMGWANKVLSSGDASRDGDTQCLPAPDGAYYHSLLWCECQITVISGLYQIHTLLFSLISKVSFLFFLCVY
jgi:hypothetical protein